MAAGSPAVNQERPPAEPAEAGGPARPLVARTCFSPPTSPVTKATSSRAKRSDPGPSAPAWTASAQPPRSPPLWALPKPRPLP